MSYQTNYIDADGTMAQVCVTDEESREAIRNDFYELQKKYNPQYVSIERMQAQPGEELHLKLTVYAPTHYLISSTDEQPKPCREMSVEIIVYLGYPIKGIFAHYASDHYLASVNVFRSGNACIDSWIPFTSSLLTVAEKLINDIIHNPNVTRYDSPANSSLIQWHKENVAAGHFPTIAPKLLEAAAEVRALPSRNRRRQSTTQLRSLPNRRNGGYHEQ